MVTFYKHDIPAWMDGTEGLSDGAYRVYHVVCQLIYLNEGPIMLNERGIAGRCCQRLDRFKAHLKTLLDAGKLVLAGEQLSNGRATAELKNIQANRQNAGKGGSQRKVNAPSPTGQDTITDSSPSTHSIVTDGSPAVQDTVIDSSADAHLPVSDGNPLKTHTPVSVSLADEVSLKEKRREEKTRKDSSEGAQDAPPKKGSRLREDWTPSEAEIAFALQKGFSLADIEVEAAKFRNYWLDKTGKDATKLAWTRTWQNWVLNAVPSGRKPQNGAPVPYQPKAKLPPRVMLDVSTYDEQTWAPLIRRYLRDQTWDTEALGPDPESKGTRIPPEVLKALGIRRRPPLVNLNNGRAPESWPTSPTSEVPPLDHLEITQ